MNNFMMKKLEEVDAADTYYDECVLSKARARNDEERECFEVQRQDAVRRRERALIELLCHYRLERRMAMGGADHG